MEFGGIEKEVELEVFNSGGGWNILIGKPILEKLQAVHDYEHDIIIIPNKKGRTVVQNGEMNLLFKFQSISVLAELRTQEIKNLLVKFQSISVLAELRTWWTKMTHVR
ncbi:hypothetical protein DL96DRAFT_1565743 [Flagelloscypha sp. PMI_526]|nr:hypothetical protein DL96DRAFT_1565743 [Flagelloscypha sp. PMI_526]